MYIRDLLARKGPVELKCVRPHGTLLETSRTLAEHNIGALLVTDDSGHLVGVVSERDLARSIVRFGTEVAFHRVEEIMTRKVVTCGPEDTIGDALEKMNRHCIRHMPVVRDSRPMAMISIREFDAAYKQLQAQSRTDELTGLANRRFFMELLNNEINRRSRFKTPLSVALLDIDHFKSINDTFGHDAGDVVLCALAKLIVHELRTFDGVGRLGGEEFAIVFPNTRAADAGHACERLLAAIRALEVETEDGAVRFTASFGVTEAVGLCEDASVLLKRADQLLYGAKRNGRNRVVVDTAAQRAVAAVNRAAQNGSLAETVRPAARRVA